MELISDAIQACNGNFMSFHLVIHKSSYKSTRDYSSCNCTMNHRLILCLSFVEHKPKINVKSLNNKTEHSFNYVG